jgi:hypothetical protein
MAPEGRTTTAPVSDAELITLMVLQALLGFTSEARWLRHARSYFDSLFPYLPTQSAYNLSSDKWLSKRFVRTQVPLQNFLAPATHSPPKSGP